MPDIAMCEDKECPRKETCYRFKAKPCEYQTYFLHSPREHDKCDYYWEMQTRNYKEKRAKVTQKPEE